MAFVLYQLKVWAGGRLGRVVVDAPGPREAARAVWRRTGAGVLVISVEAAEKRGLGSLRPGGRVSPRDLELLCVRFESMLRAGVTAQEALDVLAGQTERRAFASALRAVSESVRAGFALSAALGAHPDVFPAAFCQTVAAAEEAGALPEALSRLAIHYGREAAFRDKLRQALTYPAVVFCLALAVTGGMFGFVVPRFAALLQGAGVPLPGITRFVLAVSSHAGRGAAVLLGLLAAGVLLARASRSSGKLRVLWERLLLRLPVLGRIASRSAAARVCRNLALLLETGTPAVRALESAARTAGFSLLESELGRARDTLQGGGSFAVSLEGSRFFPGTARKMVAVGESSGQLPGMLSQAARLLELEVDGLMQRLPPFVETAMLLVVGGNVAFVMLSLFLPIVTLYQAVQK
ncbi:MAG: type II secretion system F family protein [Bacillota bacterium]